MRSSMSMPWSQATNPLILKWCVPARHGIEALRSVKLSPGYRSVPSRFPRSGFHPFALRHKWRSSLVSLARKAARPAANVDGVSPASLARAQQIGVVVVAAVVAGVVQAADGVAGGPINVVASEFQEHTAHGPVFGDVVAPVLGCTRGLHERIDDGCNVGPRQVRTSRPAGGGASGCPL